MMPLVSMIVPVYQVENYINRCLDSIMNQTFSDFECIIVNDGSQDLSREYALDYVKGDSRFKLIDKVNGGLSSARNEGIKHAKGEYLCFVDSDDCIHPQYLASLVNMIHETQADMAVCSFMTFQQDNELFNHKSKQLVFEINYHPLSLLISPQRLNFIVAWNKLMHRSLFDNIRFPEGKIHEDEFVAHLLLKQCKKVVFTENQYYFYFIRSDSIMGSKLSLKNLAALEAFENRVNDCIAWNEIDLEMFTRFMICNWIFTHYQTIVEIDKKQSKSLHHQFRTHFTHLSRKGYDFKDSQRRFLGFSLSPYSLRLSNMYGKIKGIFKEKV